VAKREQWWISKRDQTLNGRKVWAGQFIQPSGGLNDGKIFTDDSHWAARTDLKDSEGEPCGTDGCPAVFANLGFLARHRQLVHAPEREFAIRRRQEEARFRAEAEERGETIGGHPVEYVKGGPGGPVPYIKPGIA
jgi:hypothetical protein